MNVSGDREPKRHIVIAVSESESSQRAVLYVADLLGGLPGTMVTVLNIVSEPPEGYFETDDELRRWTEEYKGKGQRMVENYLHLLVSAGYDEADVDAEVIVRRCPSIAECIMEEVHRLNACTVVLGRRGIPAKEEFLFGSTSSKMLHTARNCAVWVVE